MEGGKLPHKKARSLWVRKDRRTSILNLLSLSDLSRRVQASLRIKDHQTSGMELVRKGLGKSRRLNHKTSKSFLATGLLAR